jgi:hypothetical protein
MIMSGKRMMSKNSPLSDVQAHPSNMSPMCPDSVARRYSDSVQPVQSIQPNMEDYKIIKKTEPSCALERAILAQKHFRKLPWTGWTKQKHMFFQILRRKLDWDQPGLTLDSTTCLPCEF